MPAFKSVRRLLKTALPMGRILNEPMG